MEKFRTITEDAFGRQKVSTPYTLFDAHHRYRLSNKFYSVLTNGGTLSYILDESTANLITTATLHSNVIFESTTVQPYQPGKSLLIFTTFVMGSDPSIRYRAGYFGTQNGIFFEVDDGVPYIVKRNKGVDTRVPQDNWNMNKLKGVLDVTKAQIFWIDIEWLGVGRVRCGFNIGGVQIPCHSFFHANIESGVYMTTACLPIRFEIEKVSASLSIGWMKQICATVMSEGGYQIRTNGYSQIRGRNLTVKGQSYPTVSLRLKPTTPDAIVLLTSIDIVLSKEAVTKWQIVKNNISPTWTSHAQSQLVDIDITSVGPITPSNIIFEGFIYQKQSATFDISEYDQQLSRTTVPDVYTLVVSTEGENVDANVLVRWNEF
jgi:hypothetical protein